MKEPFETTRQPTPFGWIWKCKSGSATAEITIARATSDDLRLHPEVPAGAAAWSMFNLRTSGRNPRAAVAALLTRIVVEADRVDVWIVCGASRESDLVNASEELGFVPAHGERRDLMHRPPAMAR